MTNHIGFKCRECGSIMIDYDGLNIKCPKCGNFFYKKDEEREKFLISRGWERCPICGRVGLRQRYGGFTCLLCAAKYSPEKEGLIALKSTKNIRNKEPITIKLLAVFLISIIIFSSMEMVEGATTTEKRIEFNPPMIFDEVAIKTNIANETPPTTISEWQSDLDESLPNGTYYGTYQTGSKFEFDYTPIFDTDEKYYSYVLISSHFNWSSQILMYGTSRWWLRLPVSASSIEATHGIVIGIFKGFNNASRCYLLENWTGKYFMRPSIDGYSPQDWIYYMTYNKTEDWGKPANALYWGTGSIVNDRVYLEINSILEPNIDYIISLAFSLPDNGRLSTYWTTTESPSGKRTHIEIAEISTTGAGGSRENIKEANSTIDLNLDLDWSFVFVEGIGYNGMFGRTISILEDSYLEIYPFFNTSRIGSQYMSFMLPFWSNEYANITPYIKNARKAVGDLNRTWKFDNGLDNFSPTMWHKYKDFILFSSNDTLNMSSFYDGDRWNVLVYFKFHESCNMTLLCYKRDRPIVKWNQINETAPANTSWDYWTRNNYWRNGTSTKLYYEIYMSARGTTGQWALYNGTYSGKPFYTQYFPNLIFLTSTHISLLTEDSYENITVSMEDAYYSRVNDWWGEHWFGSALQLQFRNKVEDLQELRGEIIDFLYDMWEGMQVLGKWIYLRLLEFKDFILEFGGDVMDALVEFINTGAYLVGPFLFIVLTAIGIRGFSFLRLNLRRRKKT